MDAAEDGCGINEVFRGVAFFGGVEGAVSAAPAFLSSLPVAMYPPRVIPTRVAPVGPAGGNDDHEADEDECCGPEEALQGEMGIVVLDEEVGAHHDEYDPGATPEVVAESDKDAYGDH